MVTIPTYLLVIQWALLLVLALLVIALYRQLSNYLGIRDPKGPGGLAPGTPAPAFEYRPLVAADRSAVFEPSRDGPALLVFADPSCRACEQVAGLLAESPPPGVRTLIMTGEPLPLIAASASFMSAGEAVGVIPRDVVRAYNVDATPFLFAINADGMVTASGPGSTHDEVMAVAAAAVGGVLPDGRPALALTPIRSIQTKGVHQ